MKNLLIAASADAARSSGSTAPPLPRVVALPKRTLVRWLSSQVRQREIRAGCSLRFWPCSIGRDGGAGAAMFVGDAESWPACPRPDHLDHQKTMLIPTTMKTTLDSRSSARFIRS